MFYIVLVKGVLLVVIQGRCLNIRVAKLSNYLYSVDVRGLFKYLSFPFEEVLHNLATFIAEHTISDCSLRM